MFLISLLPLLNQMWPLTLIKQHRNLLVFEVKDVEQFILNSVYLVPMPIEQRVSEQSCL